MNVHPEKRHQVLFRYLTPGWIRWVKRKRICFYINVESTFSSNTLANETTIVRKLAINQPVHICIVHECDLLGNVHVVVHNIIRNSTFCTVSMAFRISKSNLIDKNWKLAIFRFKIFPIREKRKIYYCLPVDVDSSSKWPQSQILPTILFFLNW